MSNELQYENELNDYGTDSRNDYTSERSRHRTTSAGAPRRGRKRGKAPASINGIHRRRRRKMAW